MPRPRRTPWGRGRKEDEKIAVGLFGQQRPGLVRDGLYRLLGGVARLLDAALDLGHHDLGVDLGVVLVDGPGDVGVVLQLGQGGFAPVVAGQEVLVDLLLAAASLLGT